MAARYENIYYAHDSQRRSPAPVLPAQGVSVEVAVEIDVAGACNGRTANLVPRSGERSPEPSIAPPILARVAVCTSSCPQEFVFSHHCTGRVSSVKNKSGHHNHTRLPREMSGPDISRKKRER